MLSPYRCVSGGRPCEIENSTTCLTHTGRLPELISFGCRTPETRGARVSGPPHPLRRPPPLAKARYEVWSRSGWLRRAAQARGLRPRERKMIAVKLRPLADVTIRRSLDLRKGVMKSSLFTKLLGAAFLIMALTLIAVDTTAARFAVSDRLANDPSIAELRRQIFAISLGAALFALIVAYAVSRSLSRRVSRLKRNAETLLDPGTSPHPL